MPKYAPKGGVNLRLSAWDIPRNNWMLMQNMDWTDSEDFESIQGSMKYHASSLGVLAPSAILPYYNNDLGTAEVLACVGTEIFKKNESANTFNSIFSGLASNKIRFAVNVEDNLFFASPKDGLLQYDGASIVKIGNVPNIKDIIFAREVNRAFAISADIPNTILYSDDISTSGNLPLLWTPTNALSLPPTDGDVLEKLGFLNGRLIAFMTNSVWVIYVNTSPQNWRPEKAPSVVGWIAAKTIKQVGQEFWGFGFSPATGRGLYAFNGQTSRMLSYDIKPYLDRINENLIQEACAELVDNTYKLSFALDAAIENNTTLHFDTIKLNPDTSVPNIYGPHTYGFSSSCVLNTRKFKGEHLFGSTYGGGSWIFKVGDYLTQHSSGVGDDGDLIPCALLSGLFIDDGDGYDETWFKRYGKIFANFPPRGTWSAKVELLTDFSSEVYSTYQQYLEGNTSSIEAFILGKTPLEQFQYASVQKLNDVKGRGLQIKITNEIGRTKTAFSSLIYDVRPIRRVKEAQIARIA